jgi:hypothetical protein
VFGVTTNIKENIDWITNAINFYRFLLLKDKGVNKLEIWKETKNINDTFLAPVVANVELLLAAERNLLPQVEVIRDLAARVKEITNE